MLKSSESELRRKQEYYKLNKDKILEKKHSRQEVIYRNKVERKLNSVDEFEKEELRKISNIERAHDKPENCEVCDISVYALGYPLEGHHEDYLSSDVIFVCKECHAALDHYRRTKE